MYIYIYVYTCTSQYVQKFNKDKRGSIPPPSFIQINPPTSTTLPTHPTNSLLPSFTRAGCPRSLSSNVFDPICHTFSTANPVPGIAVTTVSVFAGIPSPAWHDSFRFVICLIHTCETTGSCMWRDEFVRMHGWDLSLSYVTWLTCMWNTHLCVTSLLHPWYMPPPFVRSLLHLPHISLTR